MLSFAHLRHTLSYHSVGKFLSLTIIWFLWCSTTLFCVVSEAFLSCVIQLHWNSCRICPYWSVMSMLCEAGCHYFCLSFLISITHSMTWVWSIPSLLGSNTMRWKECLPILRKGISFVVHKLLDGWREHYPAPAFLETGLIALKPIISCLSPFFITFGYRQSGCHLQCLLFGCSHCL